MLQKPGFPYQNLQLSKVIPGRSGRAVRLRTRPRSLTRDFTLTKQYNARRTAINRKRKLGFISSAVAALAIIGVSAGASSAQASVQAPQAKVTAASQAMVSSLSIDGFHPVGRISPQITPTCQGLGGGYDKFKSGAYWAVPSGTAGSPVTSQVQSARGNFTEWVADSGPNFQVRLTSNSGLAVTYVPTSTNPPNDYSFQLRPVGYNDQQTFHNGPFSPGDDSYVAFVVNGTNEIPTPSPKGTPLRADFLSNFTGNDGILAACNQ